MERHDVFWLDGVRSDAAGVRLREPIAFSAPQPKFTTAAVPGRSGLLYQFDGSYENTTGTARCYALEKDAVQNALHAVAKWCFSSPGYHRLETAEEPDVYRMAVVTSGPKTEIRMRSLAPFDLAFDCKPQKYLKSGERAVALAQSGAALYNPGMEARPLLTVYGQGAGTVAAGGRAVQLLDIDGWLVLDCDLQDAYKGAQNKNGAVRAPEFPVLPPGDCAVAWTGGVQRVEIVPRWWVL